MTTIATRKPTGKPPWPILLIAGVEKAGKSYAAAAASASPNIGRTFWVSVGEDDPDELGALPGARFEIVEHDGTYRGVLAALTAAAAEHSKGNTPNLIVLDSATRLWELLCDEQQVEANRRARAKAAKYNRAVGDEDATVTMDQWNTAKQRWAHCIEVLRNHTGPSIVTARMEQVTILDDKGNPTKDKDWKVKAEKSLPYDVGATVELRARGEALLSGVRSLRFQPKDAHTPFPDFTVQSLWDKLGVTELDGTTPRVHTANDPDDKPAADADLARAELKATAEQHGWDLAEIAAEWAGESDVPLKTATSAAAIRAFTTELTERRTKKAEAA